MLEIDLPAKAIEPLNRQCFADMTELCLVLKDGLTHKVASLLAAAFASMPALRHLELAQGKACEDTSDSVGSVRWQLPELEELLFPHPSCQSGRPLLAIPAITAPKLTALTAYSVQTPDAIAAFLSFCLDTPSLEVICVEHRDDDLCQAAGLGDCGRSFADALRALPCPWPRLDEVRWMSSYDVSGLLMQALIDSPLPSLLKANTFACARQNNLATSCARTRGYRSSRRWQSKQQKVKRTARNETNRSHRR